MLVNGNALSQGNAVGFAAARDMVSTSGLNQRHTMARGVYIAERTTREYGASFAMFHLTDVSTGNDAERGETLRRASATFHSTSSSVASKG